MSLNGIWKIEMLGIYDWEARATAFMEDGRYWAGSANHYVVGGYEFDGNTVIAKMTIVAHGKSRTLFGKTADRHDIHFEAEVSNGTFQGVARDGDGRVLVQYRGTKLADLP